MTLTRDPARKPIKAPVDDFNACPAGRLAINSPTNAPMNGPRITPQIPKTNIPTIKPMKVPAIPNLLALYFPAPSMGARKSSASVNNINTKNITVVRIDILSKPVPIANMNRPSQASGIPGRTGRKIPRKPTPIKINPTIARKTVTGPPAFLPCLFALIL